MHTVVNFISVNGDIVFLNMCLKTWFCFIICSNVKYLPNKALLEIFRADKSMRHMWVHLGNHKRPLIIILSWNTNFSVNSKPSLSEHMCVRHSNCTGNWSLTHYWHAMSLGKLIVILWAKENMEFIGTHVRIRKGKHMEFIRTHMRII
jgi:hypothetical protein